ncbi:MAG: LytR/AlgR family response regulator transcription factor [Pseudomonadota bacterium]
MKIAVCDDESSQIKYLQELIGTWSKNSEEIVMVQAFESAEAFLFAYEEDRDFDILLLDIQMKGMNGIELARKIRKSNEMLQIIFITGFADYMAEGYDVSALHYLKKPVNEQKLMEVLNRAAARLQSSKRTILFKAGSVSMRILADDIYYAEAFSHYVTLYTKDGEKNFNLRISDMEKLLGEGFFRCHRSYIIGMKHVRRVSRTSMVLDTGKEIPISRALYDAANQAFIKYC